MIPWKISASEELGIMKSGTEKKTSKFAQFELVKDSYLSARKNKEQCPLNRK
jgi:hypothetical protein